MQWLNRRTKLTLFSSVWRSSLILAFASCYLMWGTILSIENNELRLMSVAITLLAQLNPLVEPRRGDWRPDYIPSD
jgi:V-type H+-transporting ATPase subunit e